MRIPKLWCRISFPVSSSDRMVFLDRIEGFLQMAWDTHSCMLFVAVDRCKA